MSTLFFAVSGSYLVSVLLLVVGGVANLASMSVGQTVVQLMAPSADRGRVIGVYGVASGGLRFGSGITVGLFGVVVGVRWSLGLSAAALCLGTILTALVAPRRQA